MRDKQKVTAVWMLVGAICVIGLGVMIITIHFAR